MFKNNIRFISVLVIILFCIPGIHHCSKSKEPIDYVDPFIGTLGDHGHLFPGAVIPFGMVKLGPDTYPSSLTGDGDWAHSGYNYADEQIRGFSHLRIESSGGTAVFDRSWLLSFLPWIGKPEISPEKKVASIDKQSEKASPGIYQVYLPDHKIDVALAVDKHVGFHKYTFPQSPEAHIIIDMGSNARIGESFIKIISPDEVVGYFVSQGKIHFDARFSKPFRSFSTWENSIQTGQEQIEGKKVGAILDFQTDANEIIYVKVGISTISIDQAGKNLKTEVAGWDFDNTVQLARNAWKNVLNRIIVEGNEEYKKIFYTALYHSHLQPSTTTDVDGRYAGYDKQIHMTNGYTHYDNYAFWDSYRTKYPLLSLIAPATMKDIVRSIFDNYEQASEFWFYGDENHRPHTAGFSATGPDAYRPFLNCRNEHMLTVVLDAYTKGIMKTDMETAYTGMRKEILVQMPDKYEAIGYIPARPDQTCELAYDNWCTAQMAQL